jgi:hypothetical protein
MELQMIGKSHTTWEEALAAGQLHWDRGVLVFNMRLNIHKILVCV